MSTFCGNTLDNICREIAQWQVDGEVTGDADIAPGGCFYEEAAAEIQNALLQGRFPTNFDSSTPIALAYIGSMHRKLTALLYIQSRRINLATEDVDPTRGMWGQIRAKLAAISRGEPFGEFSSPADAVQTACFYTDSPGACFMDINRML